MHVEGPDRFTITINEGTFEILDANGAAKFSGRATSRLPKLYVATAGGPPIYVGITRQSMRSRLRLGWNATGEGGYHGYRWRHHHREATLDLWYHLDATCTPIDLDIETIEAELVYLVRHQGQWPEYQTEIHFHPSTDEHRAIANTIWAHYRRPD